MQVCVTCHVRRDVEQRFYNLTTEAIEAGRVLGQSKPGAGETDRDGPDEKGEAIDVEVMEKEAEAKIKRLANGLPRIEMFNLKVLVCAASVCYTHMTVVHIEDVSISMLFGLLCFHAAAVA